MPEESLQPSRREFLGQAGVVSAVTLAAGAIGIDPLVRGDHAQALAAESAGAHQRAAECAKIRRDAAQAGLKETIPNLQHPNNGDEERYPQKIANFSKGLPHNADGIVLLSAYTAMLKALDGGNAADFDEITMGGNLRLTDPQAGLAFDLEGPDSHALVQPPAPAFASREQAAEISENYWMALLRDVPFAEYSANPGANVAAADLSIYGADFKGPKSNGSVTAATLFRGLTPGDVQGPLLSQFFYQQCYFGANVLEQQIRTPAAGIDYLTDFDSWLAVQRGYLPPSASLAGPPHFIRDGRDLAHWVHIDVLFQAYFMGFLVLAGLNAPVDDGNPYKHNQTQDGFGTFGGPHIASLLCEVAGRALKAVWYQKWFVHRRLRPEVYAARIHHTLYGSAGFPVPTDILNSLSSGTRLGGYVPAGNALLPLAFPEGSPAHPSYGAGHATVAGACVTILKAWFKESTRLVDFGIAPQQPSADGLSLVPYSESDANDLTVGGELNKLASNVALGRNIAGVHWRSDATESLKLGEQVAIGILREQRAIYNEAFAGFTLTKFDGTVVTV